MLVGAAWPAAKRFGNVYTLVTDGAQKADTTVAQYNPDGDDSVPRRTRKTSAFLFFLTMNTRGRAGLFFGYSPHPPFNGVRPLFHKG